MSEVLTKSSQNENIDRVGNTEIVVQVGGTI
jgi:hypothetical protein